MSGVFEESCKPADCLLLVAFPLTEEGFVSDLQPDSRKDYAKMVAKKYRWLPHIVYERDHRVLVNVIQEAAAAVERMGVTVCLDTRPQQLQDLSRYKVVTLVAHFNEGTREVELCDRLHPIDELVPRFDDSFTGLLDLSVCNSVFLQDRLKEKYGDRCFVRANRDRAEIKIHLILYKRVIELLAAKEGSYLEEFLKLRMQLNAYAKKK